MFFVAAKVLADEVTAADLDLGRVYPPIGRIRDVSAKIAIGVADVAYRRGLAGRLRPADLRASVTSLMYDPAYRSYVAA
jgi:malate dehydrogenase (oxaloacetate-decarboxylating)(NADP+)